MNPFFDPQRLYSIRHAALISGLGQYRLRQHVLNYCVTFHFYANGRIMLDGASLNDLIHTLMWHPRLVPYRKRWPIRYHQRGQSGVVMGSFRLCPLTCPFIP